MSSLKYYRFHIAGNMATNNKRNVIVALAWLVCILITLSACTLREEALQTFQLTCPPSLVSGQTFRLHLTAVGTKGTKPFDFTGTVELTVSAGMVTPTSLTVTNGIGTTSVTLKAEMGIVILTASNGSEDGSAEITIVETLTELPGNPEDPVTEKIPEIEHITNQENYTDDFPGLEGIFTSYNTLLLSFSLNTTVAEANAILAEIGGEIVGGSPGIKDEAAGVLVVRVPTQSSQEMVSLIEDLRVKSSVEVAVQDILLEIPVLDNAVRNSIHLYIRCWHGNINHS